MSVYFVYRSHYEGPSGKHVRRFDADTILDWFRSHWKPLADEAAREYARKLLGCEVYSFGRLFTSIAEQSVPPPRTMRELAGHLEQFLYVNEMRSSTHALQIYTDDDDLEMAIYFFDDQYLADHPARAAFLTHGEWALPATALEGAFRPAERTKELKPRGRGEGTTYAVFNTFYASDNLDYLPGGIRFQGVRLPDLARQLLVAKVDQHERELLDVRAAMLSAPAPRGEEGFLGPLRENPKDDATWQVYSDWLEERGKPRAGRHLLQLALAGVQARPLNQKPAPDPKKSKVRVEEHMAQLCLHVDRWGERDLYHQYFFFDDRWAAAHPDLANSLLRWARRWDVL
ncbi:MAG: TIGR02996 domain-containing protein [Gemmataceae bacterium]|nr:TIGR02996 domain-containing protein [Gemmataceae bacterium]